MTEDFTKELAGIKSDSLIYIYDSVFKDFIYKSRDMKPFYQQIKEMVPAESAFFIPWFQGFCSLGMGKKDEAKKFYLAALEEVKFASDYLPQFLQQGFALFMYDQEKDSAQKFWDAGVEKGIFAHSTERFFNSFDSKKQFWVQFAPKMFADEKSTEKAVIADYKTQPSDDKIQNAIDSADFDSFKKLSSDIDFDSYRIQGVSLLYYAIQKKGIFAAGQASYIENLVQVRAEQLLSNLDLSKLPADFAQNQRFTVLHQMRVTFEKSGLGQLIFRAECGQEKDLKKKVEALKKIIDLIIEKTSDVDAFVKKNGSKMGTTALHLAAECNDSLTFASLVKKGADCNKVFGNASFGLKYSDGKSLSTSIPNSVLYRLISFKAWDTLKVCLTDFSDKIRPAMTEKTDKCNITPLVYLILNTIYASPNEESYNKNKALVDSLLPLFIEAGSVLEENTAFGTAKSLLGLK